MNQTLRIESTQTPEGDLTLSLCGNISMDDAYYLRDILDNILLDHVMLLYIEGSHLSRITSPVLGVLVAARMKMDEYGGRLVLVGFNEQIQQVMAMTGVDAVLPLFPTMEQARQVMRDAYHSGSER